MASDEALYNTLFNGAYLNPIQPLWVSYTSTNITGPDLAVSTLTVNPYPAGNILLQSDTVSGTEYRAPLVFQRPVGDINAPSESLKMNLSHAVPTYPIDGEFITATKAGGTAYDDIAVKGIQIFGDQTTSGNSGAAAYITGQGGNLSLSPVNSVFISSLQVSSLQVVSVISTTAGVANSYTANLWLSTPVLYAGGVSTNTISTSQIRAQDIFTSTLTVSTLNAPNFAVSTINTSNISSVLIDTKVTLTSTLTLFGISSVSLGLGNVIQGLVGGAASQGLGAVLGGAALATGVAALVTGRTSGGVNSNVFQTVNGSTQLQFSTIGEQVSSVFLTTNSANPLTTPGVPIRQEIGVPAGTVCIRSVGDPLNIVNNISAIQMFGQWVPVPSGGGGSNFTIPSTIALSSVTVNGGLTQSGTGTFNWGGNTMSPTQVVLARPTSVNNTLTTTGGAFLNAGATVNSGLTVASGGMTVPTGNVTVNNSLFAFGILQGGSVQAISGLSVTSGGVYIANGGINIAAGNLNMTSGSSVANITNVNVSQNLNANQTITANLVRANGMSTNNINLATINNAAYPPGGGGGIPSTLQASTINVDGALTQSGNGTFNWGGNTMSPTQVVLSQPTSVNNTLTTTGSVFLNSGATVNSGLLVASGGLTVTNGLTVNGLINANNMSNSNTITSVNINVGNLRATDINLSNNGGNIDGGGQLSYQLAPGASKHTFRDSSGTNTGYIAEFYADKTSRFFSTLTVRDTTWPIIGPSFASMQTYDPSYDSQPWGSVLTSNISTNNINLKTINGSPFSPGGVSVPSTLNASTINVNGGLTVTNDNVNINNQTALRFNNSAIFGGGFGDFRIRLGTSASKMEFTQSSGNNDSIIMDLKADKTTRFYSTLLVRDSTWPNPQPSGAAIRTYDVTDPEPYGSVMTSNLSSVTANFTTGFASLMNAASISTINVNARFMTTSTIQTSSITTDGTQTVTLNSFSGNISSLTVSSINNAIYPPVGSIPTGGVMIWGGTVVGNVPFGWLLCDGSLVSKITYPNLYAAIGDSYYNGKTTGIPYDSNSFFLPDLTFAIPQGAPTPTYRCSVFAVTYPYAVSGFPPPVSSNSYWALGVNGDQTVGTLNIGTYFPPGSVPGAPAGIGYRIARVISLGFFNNPDVVEVVADNNSAVPYISTLTTLSSIGVYRANGANPAKYWRPGTFNDYYLVTPPATPLEQPTRNVFNQLDATNIPAHVHNGVPSIESTALGGASLLCGASGNPGSATSVQTNATKVQGSNYAAPYATHPHVLNMFYIIKT